METQHHGLEVWRMKMEEKVERKIWKKWKKEDGEKKTGEGEGKWKKEEIDGKKYGWIRKGERLIMV